MVPWTKLNHYITVASGEIKSGEILFIGSRCENKKKKLFGLVSHVDIYSPYQVMTPTL